MIVLSTSGGSCLVPLHSPRGQCASILWYKAGHRHVIYERWAASQTVQCTHALNLGEKEINKSDICNCSFDPEGNQCL